MEQRYAGRVADRVFQNAALLDEREGCLREGAVRVGDGNPLSDLSLLEDQGKHLCRVAKGGEVLIDRLS